jgi:hypothetical protein
MSHDQVWSTTRLRVGASVAPTYKMAVTMTRFVHLEDTANASSFGLRARCLTAMSMTRVVTASVRRPFAEPKLPVPLDSARSALGLARGQGPVETQRLGQVGRDV